MCHSSRGCAHREIFVNILCQTMAVHEIETNKIKSGVGCTQKRQLNIPSFTSLFIFFKGCIKLLRLFSILFQVNRNIFHALSIVCWLRIPSLFSNEIEKQQQWKCLEFVRLDKLARCKPFV